MGHTKEAKMKNLKMMNTILDDATNNMTELMNTAGSWHGGQTSALYSLVSTEKVHSEEHRDDLVHEIECEICQLDNSQPKFKHAETKSLGELLSFVNSYIVDDEPTQAEIDNLE